MISFSAGRLYSIHLCEILYHGIVWNPTWWTYHGIALHSNFFFFFKISFLKLYTLGWKFLQFDLLDVSVIFDIPLWCIRGLYAALFILVSCLINLVFVCQLQAIAAPSECGGTGLDLANNVLKPSVARILYSFLSYFYLGKVGFFVL